MVAISRLQGQFPQNERKVVITKSLLCPGPHWRPLPVGFVVSEQSGQRTETGFGTRPAGRLSAVGTNDFPGATAASTDPCRKARSDANHHDIGVRNRKHYYEHY